MKQQKSKTKKTLLSAIIVLIVCIAMLLGTTFAWFSDSVSNTGNRIQAGKLKIDLLMDKTLTGNYVSIAGKDDQGCIFKEAAIAQNSNETLWEPGKTQVVFLAIENKGNLALKYQTHIDVTDNGLAGALEYALFDGATYETFVAAGKTNWTELKALTTQTGPVVAGRTTISTGVLDEIAHNPSVENERDYIALAVHMKEDAGNEYQDKDIIIDVSLAATQMTAEQDGFGSDQYDANAVYPSVPMVLHIKASSDNLAMTGSSTVIDKIDGQSAEGTDTIQIKTQGTGTATVATVSKTVAGDKMKELLPASSADQTKDREMVLSLKIDTTEKSETSITYELQVLADLKYTSTSGEIVTESDKKITTEFTDILTGSMYIGENLKNVTFKHSDQTMEKLASASTTPGNKAVGGYYYDPSTGYATIKASQFSPFTATFDPPVAAIDGQAYYSLAEAIDAISASSGNNKTIYIQRDISNASGLSVNTSKNFTIDFGGHTYTVNKPGAGSTGTQTAAFQLVKDQTITFKNGTINVSSENLTEAVAPAKNIKRLFQSYANVNLIGMTIDATNLYENNAAIEFANGNVNITGNTGIKAKSGVNAINVDSWTDYPNGAHVTINTTGSIDGIYLYSEGSGTQITKSSLIISGGNFAGITEKAEGDVNVSLTGGTYSAKPADKYVSEEYCIRDNHNGTWTVKSGHAITAETEPNCYNPKCSDCGKRILMRDRATTGTLSDTIPVATITEYGKEEIAEIRALDERFSGIWQITTEYDPIGIEAPDISGAVIEKGYQFTDDNSSEIREFYSNWLADYVLSCEKNSIANGQAAICGQYGSFPIIGFNLYSSWFPTNEARVPLLTMAGQEFTYSDILNNVSPFLCGVIDMTSEEMEEADLTVQLCIFDPDDNDKYIVCGERIYTFGGETE